MADRRDRWVLVDDAGTVHGRVHGVESQDEAQRLAEAVFPEIPRIHAVWWLEATNAGGGR